MTDKSPRSREVIIVERGQAARVLRRAGYTEQDIDGVLAGVQFPLTERSLERHGQQFGISRGSLTDRLGGSP